MIRSIFSILLTLPALLTDAQHDTSWCYDSHFHLTNYIQEGNDIHRQLEIMGGKVGRSTLFGIPLQQTWAYGNSGDFAPNYYLASDAPLYYYSFTDLDRDGVPVTNTRRAIAFRSHDHRFQSGRYVCGGSYPAGIDAISRRFRRHRGIRHSQRNSCHQKSQGKRRVSPTRRSTGSMILQRKLDWSF